MVISKRSMLLSVYILLVVIEIVNASRLLDYSDPIGDVSSDCNTRFQVCKPTRKGTNGVVTQNKGMKDTQKASSPDNMAKPEGYTYNRS